jgi:hypothetical protein
MATLRLMSPVRDPLPSHGRIRSVLNTAAGAGQDPEPVLHIQDRQGAWHAPLAPARDPVVFSLVP